MNASMKEQNKGKYVNLNQIYRHLREHCTKNTKKNRFYTVRELADAMTNLKDSSYYFLSCSIGSLKRSSYFFLNSSGTEAILFSL